MFKKDKWQATVFACYRSSFVLATTNNISPLFFIIYQEKFGLSYSLLASLILFNFCTQILVDLLCVKYVDKIGYRKASLISQAMGFFGLVSLCLLPNILPSAFVGLAISSTISAVGGGMTEVIVSPIVDSIPSDAKASAMSMLHSFYCWGQVLVVVGTTLVLKLIGADLWYIIPLLWSLLPLYNFFSYLKVPLNDAIPTHESTSIGTLLKSKLFIYAMIIMLCAGASEIAICQWSSLFVEKALGIPKVLGDLLGPCLFAVFMGIGRTIFGIYGEKINLFKTLFASGILCVLCYFGTAFFSSPILALICIALCGLSVSLMWPGTLSCSAAVFPKGSTAMFGILAVMGDLGCSVGPALIGVVSDFAKDTFNFSGLNPDQIGLKVGLSTGSIFPIILIVGIVLMMSYAKKHKIDVQKRDEN